MMAVTVRTLQAPSKLSEETRRRRVDLLLLTLLAGASLCLPLSIQQSRWVPEAGRLFYTTFWALLTGVLMGRGRMRPWLAWILGIMFGLEYALQFAGKLLPRLGLIFGDVGRAAGWLWNLVRYRTIGPEWPFSRSVEHLLTRSTEMIANVSEWILTTRAGGVSRDNTVLWFLTAFAVWLLTWFAAYELFRARRSFLAMLPMGVAIVANVSITYIGLSYVHAYLGITLLVMVVANVERLQDFWQRIGLDFSPELRRDTLMAGTGISALILVVALLMPYITYNRAVFAFWDRYGPTLTEFYNRLDRTFAGRNPVPTPKPNPKEYAGHVITRGTALTEDVLLTVKTSDPRPPTPEELETFLAHGEIPQMAMPPKHYWRERTYDVYTGHGWESSERQVVEMPASALWHEPTFPYTVLTQTCTLKKDLGELAFGVNEPVRVLDKPYRVVTRGAEDFSALSVEGLEYTVVSYVPKPTVEGLRAAEEEYPDWVRERYLQLPPDIPQRVLDKAREIVETAGATTRYDKARAIEAYIRNFDYDLNVEPPPLDADIVDYFLFTVQRGYCDYSATAMTVMLRAVGVAARYASGFGMGEYDFAQNAYVVTAKNAHAWVEVYFPGYGWVEFEPTPIERIFEYTGSSSLSPQDLSALLEERQAEEHRGIQIPLWGWGLVLVGVIVFVIVWPPRWFRRKRPEARLLIRRVYRNLLRSARWAGVEPAPGQTPSEFLQTLERALEARLTLGVTAVEALRLIQRLYPLACYSALPISAEEGIRAEMAWKHLRGVMWRFALSRPPRRAAIGSAS